MTESGKAGVRWRRVALVLLVLGILILPGTSNTEIFAPSLDLTTNRSVTFPVSINGTYNTTGVSFTLIYNASLIQVGSIVKNTTVFGSNSSITININNATGEAAVMATNTDTGFPASFLSPLVDILIQSTGALGTSPLNFTGPEYSFANFSVAPFDIITNGTVHILENPLPVVGFSATPLSGARPLTVHFTDLTVTSPTAWNWSFGDGNFSIVQNPVHTYEFTGTFTVSLNAMNASGSNVSVRTNYIVVNLPRPYANFTATPTSGTAPLPVSFTDQSLNDPTGWAWYFGDENFTAPWTQQTATAGWSARYGHSSVVMPDGSIVLMGGVNNSGYYKNDTWRSTDSGATWTPVNAGAGWLARDYHSSVVMPDGSIVLMGGQTSSTIFKNDTWRSTDSGATWTPVNASAGWPGRYGHSSVVLPDGSIVLMGGRIEGVNMMNDVWRSMDNGATWTRVNVSAGWSARWLHNSIAMPDGSIVLTGGFDVACKNDVWRSTDNGATWTQVNASPGWSARRAHSSVVMPDGSIVLTGGTDGIGQKNDVWRSTDNGATWTQVNANPGWSARQSHSSVVMPDGSIVLMGGYGGIYKNDVWRLMPAGSSAQNPSHTYTTPGTYQVALQAFNSDGYNSTRKVSYINMTSGVTTGPVHNVDTNLNYTTIQSAINSATNGDTIFVESGIYQERIVVNQTIVLRGNDTGTGGPVIDGEGIGNPVVDITASGITFDRFTVKNSTVTGSGSWDGILVRGNGVLISNCTVENNYEGIGVDHADNTRISGTTIRNNRAGIYIFTSRSTIIDNNTIRDISDYQGLYLDTSCSDSIIFNNTFTGITSDYPIILFSLSNNNTIEQNTFSEAYGGIYIQQSSSNTIRNNVIRNTTYIGIELNALVQDTNISKNNIWNNSYSGIFLTNSLNNVVSDNVVGGGQYGIYLYSLSSGNQINHNNITLNTNRGIYISSSSGNTIFNNNFTNTNNVFITGSPTDNQWNITRSSGVNIIGGSYLGGNYWAQPNGQGFSQINPDTDGDGISNAEYTLTVGNIDRLPLTNNFSTPPPVAAFTPSPTNVRTNTASVTFTDASTGSPTWWNWSFGDGSVDNQTTNAARTHTYTTAGAKTAILTVANSAGSGSVSHVINVYDLPVAAFTANPTAVGTGNTVTFDSSASTGSITGWSWNLGAGATPATSTLANPTCVYSTTGTKTISLTVSDPVGPSAPVTHDVAVVQGPVAAFTANVSAVRTNGWVQFTDTTGTGQGISSWNWSFGDGAWSNTTSSSSPEHQYTTNGTYTASLTVSNVVGSNTATRQVNVYNQPLGDFTGTPTTVVTGQIVTFNGITTGFTTGWSWNFGAGASPATSTTRNQTVIYSTSGLKTVTLTRSNPLESNTSTKVGYITVTVPKPIPDFLVNVTSGVAPLPIKFTDLSSNSPTGWAWYFGDENFIAPWTEVNASAGWSGRQKSNSVSTPDGSIVVISGDYKYDVWRSIDYGATWTQMTASAGWGGRFLHSSVAMPDGSIVLMGGARSGDGASMNDVWRSTDYGATWTQMTASAGWTKRVAHSSVAMPDGSIILLGGWSSGGSMNDVWRSTDNGATWTQMTANAGWAARFTHSSVAMPDGSVVVMGGATTSFGGPGLSDVWRSTDNGATWTQMTANAGWGERQDHCSVAMPDGSIVLMGGFTNSPPYHWNDIWRSTDYGTTWTQVNGNAGWTARNGQSSVTMPDGSIVLMGGSENGLLKNDVWRLMPAGSSAQNPSHTYTAPGVYQVALQAYNAGGYNSTRKTGYITVSTPPPVANFTANVTSGFVPLPVQFSDISTGAPTGWNWTFGDIGAGNISTLRNPVHVYTYNGTFTVSLNATNAGGFNITTRTIIVNIPAPVANFTANVTSGVKPLTVGFTDLSTGTPTGWNWSFGDGNFSTSQNPVHVYSNNGTFTVRLNVTNTGGSNVSVKTNYILVNIPAPIANFTANVTYGPAPLAVQFNDTSTGSPTSWNWSFGDFGSGNTSTLRNPVHTYMAKGNYTVSLTSGNAGGSNSTVVVGLIRVGLRPNASFTWSPSEPEVNTTVTFNASASVDPDGYITTWDWSFGDNTHLLNQTTPLSNHTFTEPRVYNVTLTVTDNDAFTGTTVRQVSVYAKKETITTALNGTTESTVGGVQSLVVNATTIESTGGNVSHTNTSVTMTNTSEFWHNVEVRADIVNETSPGNITVDNVTEVVMQSAPITSALNATLGNVSVTLDVALRQYVQDAAIEVKVTQGANETTTHGFQLAANKTGNDIREIAYTVELSNTGLINSNLTTNGTRALQKAIITMSVSHTWVQTFDNGTNHEGRDEVKIIRIPESGTSAVLDTRFVRFDATTNLDLFEADSPDGLSLFGLITLHAQAAAAPSPSAPSNSGPAPGGAESSGSAGVSGGISGGYSSPSSFFTKTAIMQQSDEGKTLITNVISTGKEGSLTVPIGTIVLGKDGKTRSTISVEMTPETDVPAVPSGAVYTFGGYAVTCTPDGATFKPAVSLRFSLTADGWNALLAKANGNAGHLTIKFYDAASGGWGDVPTTVDPGAHSLTGSVSHFSNYGVFIDTTAMTQVVIETTPAVPEGPTTSEPGPGTTTPAVKMPVTAMTTDIGLIAWLLGIAKDNPVVTVVIIAIVGGVAYFGIWKRRIKIKRL